MTRKRNTPRPPDNDEALTGEVSRSLADLGWLVPQTEDDVARAEAALADDPPELPDTLEDPAAVFDGPDPTGAAPERIAQFPDNSDTDAGLARAAREAGRITGEIEDAMRRDRQAAQKDLDQDDQPDGPDSR